VLVILSITTGLMLLLLLLATWQLKATLQYACTLTSTVHSQQWLVCRSLSLICTGRLCLLGV
jgi:hypothetical protein